MRDASIVAALDSARRQIGLAGTKIHLCAALLDTPCCGAKGSNTRCVERSALKSIIALDAHLVCGKCAKYLNW